MKNVRNILKILIVSSLISCNTFHLIPPPIERCIVAPDACICIRSIPTDTAELHLIETSEELLKEFNQAKIANRRTKRAISYSLEYCENYIATNIDDYNTGKSWTDVKIKELEKCQRDQLDW